MLTIVSSESHSTIVFYQNIRCKPGLLDMIQSSVSAAPQKNYVMPLA